MSETQLDGLLQDFLSTPAKGMLASRIDFAKTPIPQYKGLYAVIIDNVLSPIECKQLLQAAEASTTQGWEQAMVNIGGGHQRLLTEVRSCGRIIWDSHEAVDRIWKRLESLSEVKEIMRVEKSPLITGYGPSKRGEVWSFTRPNERMRFLKYDPGNYFRPHCDGSYVTPDNSERSMFTLHLYLNNAGKPSEEELAGMTAKQREEAEKNALVGGATTFHSMDDEDIKFDVMPKTGRILLFQHRGLLHSGDEVAQGLKYTMRTDLMYKRDEIKDTGVKEGLLQRLHLSRG